MPQVTDHGPSWDERVDVTPELAQKWLDNHNNHNRNVRLWKVKLLQEAMENGTYIGDAGENGVIFDWDGNIAGGQHTLHAIVRSGRTIKHLRVTRNADPRVREVLNDSLKESFSDMLAVAGIRSAHQAETLLRRAMFYDENGGLCGQPSAKYSKTQLAAAWPKYAESIVNTIHECSEWDRTSIWPGNRGTLFFAYWTLAWRSGANPERVAEFFKKTCYGTSDPDEQIMFNRLRNKFRENPNGNIQAYWILRTWNAYARNEKLTKLQAPRDSIHPETKRMVLTNKHYQDQKPRRIR